jgi:hypothetical protein
VILILQKNENSNMIKAKLPRPLFMILKSSPLSVTGLLVLIPVIERLVTLSYINSTTLNLLFPPAIYPAQVIPHDPNPTPSKSTSCQAHSLTSYVVRCLLCQINLPSKYPTNVPNCLIHCNGSCTFVVGAGVDIDPDNIRPKQYVATESHYKARKI